MKMEPVQTMLRLFDEIKLQDRGKVRKRSGRGLTNPNVPGNCTHRHKNTILIVQGYEITKTRKFVTYIFKIMWT